MWTLRSSPKIWPQLSSVTSYSTFLGSKYVKIYINLSLLQKEAIIQPVVREIKRPHSKMAKEKLPIPSSKFTTFKALLPYWETLFLIIKLTLWRCSCLYFTVSLLCYKYVSGISLSNFMEKNRTSMCLTLVYQFALDIIKTLEYLHENGLNHNGITPANILLTENPGVSMALPM